MHFICLRITIIIKGSLYISVDRFQPSKSVRFLSNRTSTAVKTIITNKHTTDVNKTPHSWEFFDIYILSIQIIKNQHIDHRKQLTQKTNTHSKNNVGGCMTAKFQHKQTYTCIVQITNRAIPTPQNLSTNIHTNNTGYKSRHTHIPQNKT